MSSSPCTADNGALSVERCAEVWQAFADAWLAPTPEQSRAQLERGITPTGTLHGSSTQTGYDAMLDNIANFRANVTAPRFDLKEAAVSHGCGMMGWVCRDGQGAVVMSGRHFIDFAQDGRMQRVVSFFTHAPGDAVKPKSAAASQ